MIIKPCCFCLKAKDILTVCFYGYIVLEKILKALVVKNVRDEAPRIHDLVELSKRAKLDLSEKELEYLKVANRFNMRTRYPDVKFNFYKMCDLKYTKPHLENIKNLYKKLQGYV